MSVCVCAVFFLLTIPVRDRDFEHWGHKWPESGYAGGDDSDAKLKTWFNRSLCQSLVAISGVMGWMHIIKLTIPRSEWAASCVVRHDTSDMKQFNSRGRDVQLIVLRAAELDLIECLHGSHGYGPDQNDNMSATALLGTPHSRLMGARTYIQDSESQSSITAPAASSVEPI